MSADQQYSDSHYSLFSEAEQKRLQSFLDGLDKTDNLDASASGGGPGNQRSSPTPVLLSSPYSKNVTFASSAGQHINHLPVPGTESHSNSCKSSGGEKFRNEKRKYRSVERNSPYPRYPRSSPAASSSSSGNEPLQKRLSTDSAMEPETKGDASSAPRPRGGGRGRKPPHELLTEEQKKANHIASEQKRRANIRIGFDQLVDIVPTLSHCHRSESLILQKSADYIRQLIDTKKGLTDRVRELQSMLGEVPDEDSSEGEMDYGF